MKKLWMICLLCLLLFALPVGAETAITTPEEEMTDPETTLTETRTESETDLESATEAETESPSAQTDEPAAEVEPPETMPPADAGGTPEGDDAEGGGAWDLKAWWTDTAGPYLFAFGLSAGAVLLELSPLMLRIKKSSNSFDKSAADINAVVKATLEHDEQWQKEKQAFWDALTADKKAAEERIRLYEEQKRQREEAFNNLLAEMQKTVSTYQESLASSEMRLTDLLQHITSSSDKTEKMVYLGFTNMSEEVINGTAKKIAKVEEDADEG